MLEILGLSHITLIVRDLDRMEEILETVLSARKVYDSGEDRFSLSPERFYLFGPDDLWLAVIKGEPLPSRSYNHLAFKIASSDYDHYLERVQALGLEVTEGRARAPGEGQSIYFHDWDNHLFELHTGTLNERLTRYAQGRVDRMPAPPVQSAEK